MVSQVLPVKPKFLWTARYVLVLSLLGMFVFSQNLWAGITETPGLRLAYADDYSSLSIQDQAQKPVTAGPDLLLKEGWTIKTKAGAAELESTRDRTVFRVAPDTTFTIKALKAQGGTEFSLILGKLRVIADKSRDGSTNLRVNTPLASAGVRGTDFLLVAKPGVTDWICVKQGLVDYSRKKDNATVKVAGGEYADATYRDFKSEKAGPDKLRELFAGMDFMMPGAPQPPAPPGADQPPPQPAPAQGGAQSAGQGSKAP